MIPLHWGAIYLPLSAFSTIFNVESCSLSTDLWIRHFKWAKTVHGKIGRSAYRAIPHRYVHIRKHGPYLFASLSLALIQRQPRRDVDLSVLQDDTSLSASVFTFLSPKYPCASRSLPTSTLESHSAYLLDLTQFTLDIVRVAGPRRLSKKGMYGYSSIFVYYLFCVPAGSRRAPLMRLHPHSHSARLPAFCAAAHCSSQSYVRYALRPILYPSHNAIHYLACALSQIQL